MIDFKNNLIGFVIFFVLAWGCADPVSAYVAKRRSDSIRKEFDSIDATLIKPSDSIKTTLTNNNYRLLNGDSLYNAYFDSMQSDSIKKHLIF